MTCAGCKWLQPDDELGPSCSHPRAMEQSSVGLDLDAAVRRFCIEHSMHSEYHDPCIIIHHD